MATFMKNDGGSNIGNRLRTFGSTGKKKKQRVKKSYQRFFDGYVEMPVEKENGKVRIERIYVADYHAADLTVPQKVLVRAAHLALFALALFFFSKAALSYNHFNMAWYCVIFEALSVGAIVFGLITIVFRYIPYFGKMTRWQYRQAVVRLTWIQRLAPLFILASSAIALITVVFYPQELKSVLVSVGFFVLSAGLIYASGLLEKRVPYITIPSGNTAPIGSIDITTMKEVKPPKPKKENDYGGADMDDLEFEAEDEEDAPRYF